VRQHKRHYSSSKPPPAPLSVRRRVGQCWKLLAVAIGVVLLPTLGVRLTSLNAQDDESTAASRESRIKAAYMYQFGRYIEWPVKRFADSKAPFVIGVVGDDRITADLDEIAKTKKIQGRLIRVQRFATPADVQACHILLLSASLTPEAQAEVIRRVSGKGILLVGESDGAQDWGCAVRFVVEENKVRIYIARKAAQREGLKVSAKLLQVAHVVD
jgi:hypothetical protein